MFYDTFNELCKKNHVAPSAVARQLGMSPAAPGRWKTGSSPDLDTATKIADYFGVSMDFLIEREPLKGHSVTNADKSVILQGNRGNNSVTNTNAPDPLSDMENEILRIFRNLDMRAKSRLMNCAFEIEDETKKAALDDQIAGASARKPDGGKAADGKSYER